MENVNRFGHGVFGETGHGRRETRLRPEFCSNCKQSLMWLALVLPFLLTMLGHCQAHSIDPMARNRVLEPTSDLPRLPHVSVNRTSASAATISWEYVSDFSRHVGSVEYVRLVLTPITDDHTVQGKRYTLSAAVRSFTVTDLVPGVDYTLMITTVNENGTAGAWDRLVCPEFLDMRCEQVGCALHGQTAQFRCIVLGGPSLMVNWGEMPPNSRLQQEPIRGGHSGTVSISNVTIRDNGLTHCLQAATANIERRKCVSLCVQEPIRITCRRAKACNRQAEFGQTVTVSCCVSGFPRPNVTWTFNGMPVSASSGHDWRILRTRPAANRHHQSASQVTLHRLRALSTHEDFHDGTVQIMANNSFHSAHRSMDILVVRTPGTMVTISQPRQKVRLNEEVNIFCTGYLGMRGQVFDWYFTPQGSSAEVSLQNEQGDISISTADRSSTLTLRLANTSHSGTYRCAVTNQLGCSREARVSFNVEATLYSVIASDSGYLLETLDNRTVITVRVLAAVTAQPPTVRWFVNSRPIPQDFDHIWNVTDPSQREQRHSTWRASSGPSYMYGNEYRYNISTAGLTVDDLGRIRCVVTLNEERHTSNVTVIARGVVVVLTDSPRVVTVKRRESVRVTCTVFSDLMRFKSDVENAGWLVRPKTHRRERWDMAQSQRGIRVTERSRHTNIAGGVFMKATTLTINSFHDRHEGLYKCRAPAGTKRRPAGPHMHAIVRLKYADNRKIDFKFTTNNKR